MRRRIISRLLYLLDGVGRQRPAVQGRVDAPGHATTAEGSYLPERPPGLVLWFHAETASEAGPLPALAQELSRIRGEPVHALLTSAGGRAPDAVASAVTAVPVPGEGATAVRAFLDHWAPDLCVMLGLPERPALAEAARARKIPMFLAFPRRDIAERRLPLLPRSLLHLFDACLAPSGQDARLLRNGLKDQEKVTTTGPLSDTALTLPCDEVELARISARLSGRPIWLAHYPGDDEMEAIEAAHRIAARSAHRLLLIIVARPGQSGQRIAAFFESAGWRTAVRSTGGDPTGDVQVFVADRDEEQTGDEEDLWFRIAPIAFCGGTIAGDMPSDPFRPAAHGTAILHGPRLGANDSRFRALNAAGAAEAVTRDDLGHSVTKLLSPDLAAELALAGWDVVSESAHVIDRLARMMDAALDAAELDEGAAP